MKITKQQIIKIIEEEITNVLGQVMQEQTGNIVQDGLRDFDKVMNTPATLKHELGDQKVVQVDALQDAVGDIYDQLRAAMTKMLEKLQEVFNSPEAQGAEGGFTPGQIVSVSVVGSTVVLRASAMIKGRRKGQPNGEIRAEAQVDRRTGDIKHGPTINMGKTR